MSFRYAWQDAQGAIIGESTWGTLARPYRSVYGAGPPGPAPCLLLGLIALNLAGTTGGAAVVYVRGDEIEVTIDRQGLGEGEGIAHLPDETMVVIAGAGDMVGTAVQATIVSVEKTPLGSSVRANAKI